MRKFDPVVVVGFPSNGSDEHLGFVTRINDDDTVNITMLPDQGHVHMLQAVPHVDEEMKGPSFMTLEQYHQATPHEEVNPEQNDKENNE